MNQSVLGLLGVTVLGSLVFASGCGSDSDSSGGAGGASGAAGSGAVAGSTSKAGTSGDTEGGGTGEGGDDSGGQVHFTGQPGTLWLAAGADTVYTLDTANGDVTKAYSFGKGAELKSIAGSTKTALVRNFPVTDGDSKFSLIGTDGSKKEPTITYFGSDTLPFTAAGSLFLFAPVISAVDSTTAAVTEYDLKPNVSLIQTIDLPAASDTALFAYSHSVLDMTDLGVVRFDVATHASKKVAVLAANAFDDETFSRAAAGTTGYYVLTVAAGDTVTTGGARHIVHFTDAGVFDSNTVLTPASEIYDDIAVGGDAVWVFFSASGTVQKLDPKTLAKIGEATLPAKGEGQSGRGIVYGGGALWVYGFTGSASGLVRIDETDLSVLTVPLPAEAGATHVSFCAAGSGISPI